MGQLAAIYSLLRLPLPSLELLERMTSRLVDDDDATISLPALLADAEARVPPPRSPLPRARPALGDARERCGGGRRPQFREVMEHTFDEGTGGNAHDRTLLMAQWEDGEAPWARDPSNEKSSVGEDDSAFENALTPVLPLPHEEAMQRILQVLQAVDAMDDCFNVFDDDRNGMIDCKELEAVAEQVGDLGRSLVQEMHMYIDEKEAQGEDVEGIDRVTFYSHFLGALGIDGDNAVRHLTQPPQLRPAPPARRLLTPARSPARAQSNASGDSDFQPDWEADLAAEIDEAATLDHRAKRSSVTSVSGGMTRAPSSDDLGRQRRASQEEMPRHSSRCALRPAHHQRERVRCSCAARITRRGGDLLARRGALDAAAEDNGARTLKRPSTAPQTNICARSPVSPYDAARVSLPERPALNTRSSCAFRLRVRSSHNFVHVQRDGAGRGGGGPGGGPAGGGCRHLEAYHARVPVVHDAGARQCRRCNPAAPARALASR